MCHLRFQQLTGEIVEDSLDCTENVGSRNLRDCVTDYLVNSSLYSRALHSSERLFFDLIYHFSFRFSNTAFLISVELTLPLSL
jgi:hypothetical protein